MYTLGKGTKPLDIEDIAIKCEEISPGTFSWRKHKDRINLELVGFAVRDAKKEQYGALVLGSHKDGWRLTANGVELAKQLLAKIDEGKELDVAPPEHRNLEVIRDKIEIARILESHAFEAWQNTGSIDDIDLSQLLRINTYASKNSIALKLARLTKAKGNSEKLDAFIDYVRIRTEVLG